MKDEGEERIESREALLALPIPLMLSCSPCFTSDDLHDDYIPLPMSPTTAAANGRAMLDQHELLLVSEQSGSPVNLLLLEEGLVVTRRKKSA